MRNLLRRTPPEPSRLDCGCPADTNVTDSCMDCGHTRCAEHRDQPHDCAGKAVTP